MNCALESRSQLFFRLCSDHLSIEAIPRSKMTIDFVRVRESLTARYDLAMWTPQFVVLKSRLGEEITVRKDGRMVIRNAKSEENARSVGTQVLTLLMDL